MSKNSPSNSHWEISRRNTADSLELAHQEETSGRSLKLFPDIPLIAVDRLTATHRGTVLVWQKCRGSIPLQTVSVFLWMIHRPHWEFQWAQFVPVKTEAMWENVFFWTNSLKSVDGNLNVYCATWHHLTVFTIMSSTANVEVITPRISISPN